MLIRISILFTFIIILTSSLHGQELTLQECYQLAKENYPLIHKKGLIEESTNYSLQNASKSFLPQFSLSGQATYQSDVTSIPVNMPGVEKMSKDQYKLQAEVSQLIFDGGAIKNQKELLKANEAVQLQNVEVNLNTLKERVSQLYFSILLFESQLKQRNIYKQNLINALNKATEALKNGTSYKSAVNELKAELLNAEMAENEIKADKKGFRNMLALLIAKPITDQTQFIAPIVTTNFADINRPELKLFDLQKKSFDVQRKKLSADWMPKISAFAQGGYGRPGLNMLNNNFSTYAIGGIRLNMPLGSLYTLKNNKSILQNNQKQLDADRETFLLNTKTSLEKENADIEKYKTLLQQDDEIIALRAEVVKSAQAQLANGVITTNEFINKLNAENLARQTKNLHEIQLLKAQTNYQTLSGY